MKLTLNISPCPNDTFMFDAIVNSRIDTSPYSFDVNYFDIEELNRRATESDADISKISFAILPSIYNKYALLNSGSALGRGNGPVFVSKRDLNFERKDLKVAIPGINTTANALLSKFYPQITDKTPLLFSEIAQAVAEERFDAGVLIHEGRFTYRERGLQLIADLGVKWESAYDLPLPLGAIVASRRLDKKVRADICALIRRSIEFAFANRNVSRDFIKSHAQEMSDSVIDKHIELFVNNYSVLLGDTGRKAVEYLTGLNLEK